MALSTLQTVVLSKLSTQLEDADVAPGTHSFDFTVRVTGQAVRGADGMQKATCRALTLETLALFIQRSGIQREKALEILVDVMRENIVMDKDQKAALMEVTGVAAAKARLDAEMDSLPKTPKKGAFKMKNVEIVECFQGEAVLLGDVGPHSDHSVNAVTPAREIPQIDEISVEE